MTDMAVFHYDSSLRNDLPNGEYLVYMDSAMSDLIIRCHIIDSAYNGSYLEWDQQGNLMLDSGYFKGKRHGLWIGVLVINNRHRMNISRYVNGLLDEEILVEW